MVPQVEIDSFLATLSDLRNGDMWRICGDDPYGSDAIFEAMSLMMKGPNFDVGPLEITFDIAGFAIHVVSHFHTLIQYFDKFNFHTFNAFYFADRLIYNSLWIYSLSWQWRAR
jgi:hypothetical protein